MNGGSEAAVREHMAWGLGSGTCWAEGGGLRMNGRVEADSG
jgi:hypothetical protein